MRQLFTLKKTTRPWHLPVVAGLCVGIPLLLGVYFDNIAAGKLASVGALVILYMQSNHLANRLMTLMICGFGFILSYAVGSVFSSGYWLLPPVILAVYTFAVHYALFQFNLNKPPGNFFFTMLTSMAISTPKALGSIAINVGYVALGVMLAWTIGLLYSLMTLKREQQPEKVVVFAQNKYVNMTESVIFGVTVGLALLVAKLLHMENPYWIPVSCMAVMQGVSSTHVWERTLHRVLGTIIGLGLTWITLQLPLTIWQVCICILLLQAFVEFLVVRNYGLAVIFISMLTIFLAEPNISLTQQSNVLIYSRLVDTVIGSAVGAVGGWILYNNTVHFYSRKQIRKTYVRLKRRR
ncbi:FUSC family protein [Sphingobacterium sp. LRF_L2]|uniref:FUSC family protein n=1 Tax=Sphingobacterium sp. LRF_L2 TaxID=3369421 RepID=UPI003F6322DD